MDSTFLKDSILVSSPMNLTIYMRSQQRFIIEVETEEIYSEFLGMLVDHRK